MFATKPIYTLTVICVVFVALFPLHLHLLENKSHAPCILAEVTQSVNTFHNKLTRQVICSDSVQQVSVVRSVQEPCSWTPDADKITVVGNGMSN